MCRSRKRTSHLPSAPPIAGLGRKANLTCSPYNAAKAAVRHLAASLSVEWAKAGIRVNCISPGYMLTAL